MARNAMRMALGSCSILAACTIGPQNDEEVSCDKAARTGSYLLQYSVISGTCGLISSEVRRFESGAIVDDDQTGCTYGAPSFRNGDCSAVIRSVCAVGTGSSTADVDLAQIDDDGASLSGTAQVRVVDGAGTQICSGTYRVSATRQ